MRKKKSAAKKKLVLRDINGDVIYSGSLDGMAIPEEVVRAICYELYLDPEPCFFRRSAAVIRILAELEDVCSRGKVIDCSLLPDNIQKQLGMYPGVMTMEVSGCE